MPSNEGKLSEKQMNYVLASTCLTGYTFETQERTTGGSVKAADILLI